MELLPTPHSIAIASLISLYSDPFSPLYTNHHHDEDQANNNNDDDDDDDDDDEAASASPSASWPTRLSALLRQLVREEEEGNLFRANNDDSSTEEEEKDRRVEIMTTTMAANLCRDRRRRIQRVPASSTIRMENASLSSLLNRIDAAFSNPASPRTPPSVALSEKLARAAQSIEHLSQLTEEFLALLEGRAISHRSRGAPASRAAVAIDGNSSLGIHLRKLCLGMEELPFEASSRLWISFREFVFEAREETAQRGGGGGEKQTMIGAQGGRRECRAEQRWMPSSSRVEDIVRRTCWRSDVDSLLKYSPEERYGMGQEELSIPIDDSLQQQQQQRQQQQQHSFDLLKTHPECPSLHFLHYYSSLLRKERSRALESLHRYFDYGMIHERKERVERNMLLLLAQGAGAGPNNAARGGGGGGGGNNLGDDGFLVATGRITTAASGEQPHHRQQQHSHPHSRGRNAANGNSVSKSYKESNMMQYAAVVLAQMYHRFGYRQLARQATEEAIRVGQQSGDEECVSFARGWSAYLCSGGENYNRVGNLRRCWFRAVEGGGGGAGSLASLVAGTSLELGRREACGRIGWGGAEEDELEANEEEMRGGEVGPSVAWESIRSAGRVSSVFGPTSGGGMRGLMMGSGASRASGRGIAVGQLCTDVDNITCNEALRILGRQSLAISGLWDSTGHTSMASLSSRAALFGFGPELTEEDAAFAMRRVLASFSFGPGLDTWVLEGNEGHDAMPQDCCVYSICLKYMSSLHGKGSVSEWVQSAASILHEWSVRSHDLNVARSLQSILANHAAFPSGANFAVEATLVSLSRSTHLHVQTGDFATAKAATRRACMLANKHSLLLHQGWQLLQLALIDLEASTASPSINASVERALPPLLECLYLSKRHAMDPLRAVALTTLAKILLCMGRFLKARALLNAAMPLVMQHGHLWFQAEACLTLAKCNLAEARWKVSESSGDVKANAAKRKNLATRSNFSQSSVALQRKAFSQLDNAASLFNRIDDIHRLRQTYYLQAMVCNSLPYMQTKRDELATKFAQVSARRQCSSKLWNAMHGILVGASMELAHYTTPRCANDYQGPPS